MIVAFTRQNVRVMTKIILVSTTIINEHKPCLILIYYTNYHSNTNKITIVHTFSIAKQFFVHKKIQISGPSRRQSKFNEIYHINRVIIK